MRNPGSTKQSAEAGSILIVAVVTIATVGVITVGMLSLLGQGAAGVNERAEMARGFAAADSLRLALLDGREAEAVRVDLLATQDQEVPGALGEWFIDLPAGNQGVYSAGIEQTDGQWGYRFSFDPGGLPGVPPEDHSEVDPGETRYSGNDQLPDRFFINGDATLDLTGNVDLEAESGIVDGDLTIDLNPNSKITVGELRVAGDVTVSGPEGDGTGRLFCIEDSFQISGNFADEIASNDCEPPKPLDSSDAWEFANPTE